MNLLVHGPWAQCRYGKALQGILPQWHTLAFQFAQ